MRRLTGALDARSSNTDAEGLPALLEQLGAQALGRVHADGAYDQRRCYEAVRTRQGRPLIPPREDAVAWEAEHPHTQAVAACREVGRKAWKQRVGYHRRSLAETAVYRYQQLIAPRLRLRPPHRSPVPTPPSCSPAS